MNERFCAFCGRPLEELQRDCDHCGYGHKWMEREKRLLSLHVIDIPDPQKGHLLAMTSDGVAVCAIRGCPYVADPESRMSSIRWIKRDKT